MYNVGEADVVVEVCMLLSMIPSGRLECDIVITLNAKMVFPTDIQFRCVRVNLDNAPELFC